MVRKIGTNKTQILHRMRLRQFTPRQPIPDTPVRPREWQPDPEVIIKHDDLHATAWECEYDKPIFDSDRDNLYHLIHPKSQYDRRKHPMKRGVLQERKRGTPQIFSPTRMR